MGGIQFGSSRQGLLVLSRSLTARKMLRLFRWRSSSGRFFGRAWGHLHPKRSPGSRLSVEWLNEPFDPELKRFQQRKDGHPQRSTHSSLAVWHYLNPAKSHFRSVSKINALTLATTLRKYSSALAWLRSFGSP
jgi:hypothetical protein